MQRPHSPDRHQIRPLAALGHGIGCTHWLETTRLKWSVHAQSASLKDGCNRYDTSHCSTECWILNFSILWSPSCFLREKSLAINETKDMMAPCFSHWYEPHLLLTCECKLEVFHQHSVLHHMSISSSPICINGNSSSGCALRFLIRLVQMWAWFIQIQIFHILTSHSHYLNRLSDKRQGGAILFSVEKFTVWILSNINMQEWWWSAQHTEFLLWCPGRNWELLGQSFSSVSPSGQ